MPVRFHRSIKLFSGFRLNLSKSGLGASVGPKGMRVSLGPRGVRTTQSLPGTGVSFIQQSKKSSSKSPQPESPVYAPPSPKKPMPLSKKILIWAAGIIIGIPVLLGTFQALSGDPLPTPTPTTTSAAIVSITDTSTPVPTETAILQPTQTQLAGCACEKDYNCSDFSTHAQAQACFNSCGGTAAFNWSNLDGTDHDGDVCETLP